MYFLLFILLINISSAFSSLQILKARENVNVTITCRFDRIESKLSSHGFPSVASRNNLPDNIILWYKDNSQVIGVNSISNDPKKYLISQVNSHTYQLIVLNVQLESMGLYKCQNFTAKEENRFQLNVLVPPSRLRLSSSPELPVHDGTSVSFNCLSERVYPNPIFEWYKNDQLIQRSIGNQTDSVSFSSSAILTLFLTPADHNHILRCQVSNEASIDQTKVQTKLEILFKPIIKIFSDERPITKTLTVLENTLGLVSCRVSSNPAILSRIQWFTNDQLIPGMLSDQTMNLRGVTHSIRQRLINHPLTREIIRVTIFYSILGENQEQLRLNWTQIENLSCQAMNTIGQTEARIDVNILYKPKLTMEETLTLNQGEKMILKCSINANPSCYQIRWLFNEKEFITQSCRSQQTAEYVIDNIDRSQAGKYTCEVRNWLNTTSENASDGLSQVSTNVRVQYAPFILNTYKKLAVLENTEITTECLVDAYPRAEIVWFGPSGQRLSSFSEEKIVNSTVRSSVLNLPSSYSSMLGSYRCVAKNVFGQYDFSVEFQRPGLPDPPTQLQATNLTSSSFLLTWQSGYDGGSEQTFEITLSHNHTEQKQTNLPSVRFEDLNEKTRYVIKIRAKNNIGFSNYSSSFILMTKEAPFRSDDFPSIEHTYYDADNRRLHIRLNSLRTTVIPVEQLCVQYYSNEDMSACIPFLASEAIKDGLEINMEQMNLRLRLCLISQTDVCSKSIFIPNGSQETNKWSDFILTLIGGILGLCIVISLIGLFICIHQRRRQQKSKTGSTDTLKTNSDLVHSIPSVRVSDTNSCLYYPANDTRTSYFNDETTGVYCIQEKKRSLCFDSGMPSTTSNNSDSAGSQALSSLDSEGDYLVHGRRRSTYALPQGGADNHVNISINGRTSSEEESGFSTPTKSHQGKKLVYEVVV